MTCAFASWLDVAVVAPCRDGIIREVDEQAVFVLQEEKMPNVAAFVAIQSPNLEIPHGVGINDRHFQFELPGLTRGSAILLFRVQPLRDTRFSYRINSEQPHIHNMDAGNWRSLHELTHSNSLNEDANQLTIAVDHGGKVLVSDIVLIYQVAV